MSNLTPNDIASILHDNDLPAYIRIPTDGAFDSWFFSLSLAQQSYILLANAEQGIRAQLQPTANRMAQVIDHVCEQVANAKGRDVKRHCGEI